MSITFPTSSRRGQGPPPEPGLPQRAKPCRCAGGPLVLSEHDDTCVRCGRYPKATIRRTWRDRAIHLSTSRVHQLERRQAA